MTLTEIRLALVERREIPEPVLLRIVADLDAQKALWPDRIPSVEFERHTFEWMVDAMFTDDQGGDGFPILTTVQMAQSLSFAPLFERDQRPDWLDFDLVNLFGVTLATRKQTLAAAQPYFDALTRLAPLDRPERTPEIFDRDAFLAALPRRHAVTRLLIDSMAGAHAKWLETEDNHALDLLGRSEEHTSELQSQSNLV